jgi:hypothetical protein
MQQSRLNLEKASIAAIGISLSKIMTVGLALIYVFAL